MGSGKGVHDEADDRAEIREFLIDVRKRVGEGRIRVHEQTRTHDSGHDHSFPVTTGYTLRHHGIGVRYSTAGSSIIVDGKLLGPEVCDAEFVTSVRDACVQRVIEQQSDAEFSARQAKEERRQQARQGAYRPLADKLRSRRKQTS